ncbi:extracellular solute-binding protein [Devosia sp. FKR38]|uniref:ABC transporter substrate-binding protein n=1 Tax=Devosia sp. FKR38 TaxID=2562312 RepID=UPI001485602D|nr:extracellular solute-binding protein [Devosia sp. FKR38]
MTALSLMASLNIQPAQAGDLLLMHRWSTPAELAALNVLRDKVESRGDRWIPLAINGDGARGRTVLDMLAEGIAPTVFLEMHPEIYRPLAKMGRLLTLERQFTNTGLIEHLPELVRQAITVDGAVVKVPAALHADATIYYNKDVARAAGIDPETWTSLDAMWADFPAIRKAGILPLAIGRQPWQITYLAMSLLASLGGAEPYNATFGTRPDPRALNDPAFADMLTWLRRFQQEADAAARGRDWNIATRMVISGQALMQIQVDSMKAEWHAAGKAEGTDYGCIFLPGARAVPFSVESWGLVGGSSPEADATARAFADDMTAIDTQTRFAAAMGAIPVRRDAWTDLDGCATAAAAAVERPGYAVPTPMLTTPVPWILAIQTVLTKYWDDASMSPEQAIHALRNAAPRALANPSGH